MQDVDKLCQDGYGELARRAELDGWAPALYAYARHRVIQNEPLPEDQRSSDWVYYLPLVPGSVVLVVGGGLGSVPLALSWACQAVHVVDSDDNKVRFITARKDGEAGKNIFPVMCDDLSQLPYAPGSFDAVLVHASCGGLNKGLDFAGVVGLLSGLLKEHGTISLCVENKLSIQKLLGKAPVQGGVSRHTLMGYQRILKSAGFQDVQAYAPLPHIDGIPLFYLPMGHAGAMRYFFSHVFPLFEMVSPEVKKQYGVQYVIAKLMVRLAVWLRFSPAAKFFFSGYLLVATRGVKKI